MLVVVVLWIVVAAAAGMIKLGRLKSLAPCELTMFSLFTTALRPPVGLSLQALN